eukprot:TRINITY_DN1550_c0_g1_i6.p3 TRINITY_DN1550_c0_g1~~TRINITY_DN1550_c0_g1_i6.p3  ORF type:complete len:181 (-),score=28.69 TRINITY_DN1550_c0_g1_i6:122-664(-)
MCIRDRYQVSKEKQSMDQSVQQVIFSKGSGIQKLLKVRQKIKIAQLISKKVNQEEQNLDQSEIVLEKKESDLGFKSDEGNIEKDSKVLRKKKENDDVAQELDAQGVNAYEPEYKTKSTLNYVQKEFMNEDQYQLGELEFMKELSEIEMKNINMNKEYLKETSNVLNTTRKNKFWGKQNLS